MILFYPKFIQMNYKLASMYYREIRMEMKEKLIKLL